jgi:hypothetical protein
MALPIAATTSSSEIAPTRRVAPGVRGKSSRITPMAVTSSAQTASTMPAM